MSRLRKERSLDQSKRSVPPPEADPTVWKGMELVRAPVQRFMELESAGGYALAVAAVVAMVWVNLDHASYESVWEAQFGFSALGRSFVRPLHFWVNDAAMSLFFLLAGLEIKRQMVEGELSTMRRAALPVIAALGGMAVPMAIFFAFNPQEPDVRGTAVPCATDIAFAVGVLTLLGKRVPASVKVLLLTLAVADDIGGIVVIAAVYNTGLSWVGLVIATLGAGLFWFLRLVGKRPGWIYYSPLLVVWGGLLEAGIHPTLAGVVIGLMIPAKPWITTSAFEQRAAEQVADIRRWLRRAEDPGSAKAASAVVMTIRHEAEEALSPLVRLEHAIQPIVVFGITPVFALANAGVYLGGDTLSQFDTSVALGIGLGLLIGKPVGVFLATWLSSKSGLCQLPKGMTWPQVTLVGLLAGIGFTVSNFIALLAFTDPMLIGTAKFAILIGSALSMIVGLAYGRAILAGKAVPEGAPSLLVAESSDEV